MPALLLHSMGNTPALTAYDAAFQQPSRWRRSRIDFNLYLVHLCGRVEIVF